MEPGNIVEFIESQKIVCAVVLEIKKQRLRVLTEANREANLAATRLAHRSEDRLNLSLSRDKLIDALKQTVALRKELMEGIRIEELWEVLHAEDEWIDLPTMASFCFSGTVTPDHESAVMRAFFDNRLYFKFDFNRFLPFSEAQVEQNLAQKEKEERENRLIRTGGDWLKNAQQGSAVMELTDDIRAIIGILKSCYLFEKESPTYSLAKAMLDRAGMGSDGKLFNLLVKIGVWDKDENIDLLRLDIPTDFSEAATQRASEMTAQADTAESFSQNGRTDLTDLPLMTIDGESTLDFDDALSIERLGDQYRLGIHIVDVGQVIQKGDRLDQEAMGRGSSIYMPDRRLPMLPPRLSEDLCSLRAGVKRPAISIFAEVDGLARLKNFEIVPSIVRVARRLTFAEVDQRLEQETDFQILYDLGKRFRDQRLAAGAIQINLPEIYIQIDEKKQVEIVKVDRESPGRMLVAEMMIMANWLMARFLSNHQMAAIFRAQPDPKSRIIKEDQGGLFEHCMQRKHLSRVVLGTSAEHHAGLGLDNYVTATSPIRKYFDLVTQRQIRAVLGLETPYTEEEVRQILHGLEQTLQQVGRIQFLRNRYWLLKYLEKQIGGKMPALVLDKRREGYGVMLLDYMLECRLPLSGGDLKPGDRIHVTLQHANARNDLISVYL